MDRRIMDSGMVGAQAAPRQLDRYAERQDVRHNGNTPTTPDNVTTTISRARENSAELTRKLVRLMYELQGNGAQLNKNPDQQPMRSGLAGATQDIEESISIGHKVLAEISAYLGIEV